jgi:agmatinase
MKINPLRFLEIGEDFTHPDQSAVAVLPVPYEGGVSYGRGAAQAPSAVLDASRYLELYDEVLKAEPYRVGITTISPPMIPQDQAEAIEVIYRTVKTLLDQDKFVVVIGGDHSISSAFAKALHERHGSISVVQIDAHADLRDSYDGSVLSHASVMSRIREVTAHTLQVGIRSLSREEAERVEREGLALCTMHDFRQGTFDLDSALKLLPDPVFLTLDVDALDWSVVFSTGTPEPGGFLWDEAIQLLARIFSAKDVIGFDVVELAYSQADRNSPFAVAKLIYKLIGFKLARTMKLRGLGFPEKPAGPIFRRPR